MNGITENDELSKIPLYEQVADKLEKSITNEEYPNGGRLPSEQTLCEMYGVSRTIVREALKLLKERGLIETRTGSGAYATKPEAQNISDVVSRIISIDKIDYINVFSVREILENEAAAMAAKNATEEQIQEFDEILSRMKDPDITNEQQASLDFTLHHMIARASGNQILSLLVEAMGGICRGVIERTSQLDGSRKDAYIRHSKIIEAIRRQDGKGAREASREHLEESARRYKNYLEKP